MLITSEFLLCVSFKNSVCNYEFISILEAYFWGIEADWISYFLLIEGVRLAYELGDNNKCLIEVGEVGVWDYEGSESF